MIVFSSFRYHAHLPYPKYKSNAVKLTYNAFVLLSSDYIIFQAAVAYAFDRHAYAFGRHSYGFGRRAYGFGRHA